MTAFSLLISGLLSPGTLLANNDQQPEIEFLEYLADWQTDQGELLDPLDIQDITNNTYTQPSTEASNNE